MSKPDQDECLIAMGKSEATCDKCMLELYPNIADSVCYDCKLNPIVDDTSASDFAKKTIERESRMSTSELMSRADTMKSKGT